MKKYHSAKLRKIRVTKKLRDLWQHDPELEEILIDTCGSEKWLQLMLISGYLSSDPKLAKTCLNCAYVNHLTKFNRKSKAIKRYTAGDIHDADKLRDNGCP